MPGYITFKRPQAVAIAGGLLVAVTCAFIALATPEVWREPMPEPQGAGQLGLDASGQTAQGGGAGSNMTYHGGPVQHIQKVFTIFWNPSGTPFPVGYQTTVNQFVQDLKDTTYYGIASQYNDSIGRISTTVVYGGTWLDTTNSIPNTSLSYSDLLAEVNRAMAANAWTSGANSYFQVYTPSGVGTSLGSNFCGVHWFANPAVGQIVFPQGGCFMSGPWPNGQTVDAAIDFSAHEILETVTDPLGTAWFSINSSGEIGDLCNFVFGARAVDGSDLTLNGRKYIVQQEWSNADSACVSVYKKVRSQLTSY
jgi:hypothetical protein